MKSCTADPPSSTLSRTCVGSRQERWSSAISRANLNGSSNGELYRARKREGRNVRTTTDHIKSTLNIRRNDTFGEMCRVKCQTDEVGEDWWDYRCWRTDFINPHKCRSERYLPTNPNISLWVCKTDIAIIGPIAEKANERKKPMR